MFRFELVISALALKYSTGSRTALSQTARARPGFSTI